MVLLFFFFSPATWLVGSYFPDKGNWWALAMNVPSPNYWTTKEFQMVTFLRFRFGLIWRNFVTSFFSLLLSIFCYLLYIE